MSEYKINILPLIILKEEVDVTFSVEEKEGYDRIYKRNLPNGIPENIKDNAEKYAWWSINPGIRDITYKVNLKDNKRFAKHYFNKILYLHFMEMGFITNRNFINDTLVYLEDQSFNNNNEYKKYNSFSLKFDHNNLIPNSCLLVSYEGDTFILKNNLFTTNLEDNLISHVSYQGRIASYKYLNDIEKSDRKNIYPKINPKIRKKLNLPFERNFSENKYKKYFDFIQDFYNSYLKDLIVGNTIQILGSGFYKPNVGEINHTSEDSNLLLFGNNQKNFIPYIGIKEYGPIQSPLSDKTIKFIFIFHKDDKEYANKLYSFLKNGYKSFPGLESFVKIDFEIDQEKTIRFTELDPIAEIKDSLQKFIFDPDITYGAIYISRIKKETEDEEEDKVYYKLKELLLNYKITSQVIFKENIDNPSFNYFLPNIAIALLAKLEGIPWRLYRPIQNDLVVGIGAKRERTNKTSYIGSAFCFKNDGSFRGFNVYEKDDTSALASSIKEAIKQYINENRNFDRLVIHYYKEMSREEEEPIQKLLMQLNPNVPYVVLTISETESKDYVLFDSSFDGIMPQSGTFIKIRWNEFLLCNNTRYSNNTATKIDGFPFPIKIKIKHFNYQELKDMRVVKDLIDQVYQFSRMYWKSVRQRNMPVTIEYSKLIASMVANFENKELVPFAKNSLWFL